MRRALIIVLVILFCPALSSAQTDEVAPEEEPPTAEEADPFEDLDEIGPGQFDDGRAGRDERPMELMTREELERAGFQFGAEAESADTSTALLLALSAGIFVHGIGHLYLGDSRTGFFLLGMEALALGLVASSGIFFGVTEGASPLAAVFAPALQLGLAMFAYSYVVDVLGALRGNELEMAPNTSLQRGIGFRARYGFLNSVELPMRHVIDAQLIGDAGLIYASAATTQDVLLDGASYRGRVGVRPIRGVDPLTYVHAEAGGEYYIWQGDGEFGRIGADGRVGGSYQLGRNYPHIDQLAIAAEIGLGNYWYQFAPRGTTTFELADQRLYVPFDVWASLNVSQRLNVRGGYGSSETSLIAPVHRMLGILHVDFTYRSSSYGDISLRAEAGDGFAIYLGGGLWFGR